MEVEMKMTKSLLLGTAAGLIAVTGAQAADMPVKAAPVQYVRICTLYGDAFYYIPGTDTCIKIGGYVRVQVETKAGGGGIVDGTLGQQVQARYTRDHTADYDYRVRGAISWDVRQQTQYGTLRTYIRMGVHQTTPADSPAGSDFWDRAFIQFAGFTIGKAQSFYDTVTYGGAYSYHNVRTVSDTGASGWNVWAYTAQFGNGLSGTLSLEDPNRGRAVVDLDGPGFWTIGGQADDNAFGANAHAAAVTASGAVLPYAGATTSNGFRMPDVVANLRLDQAWGYISGSVAMHDVAGAYWEGVSCSGTTGPAANCETNGHPADKKGWAFSLGAVFNVGGGSQFGINGQYSVGASGYGAAPGQVWSIYNSTESIGLGWANDGVFDIGREIELTTVWNVIAFYQHIWSPNWRTSVFGGYVSVEYTDAAKQMILSRIPGGADTLFLDGDLTVLRPGNCITGNASPLFSRVTHVTLAPGNSCDPDFSFWQIGTRTQWNPVAQLDIGVEFLYTHLNTAFAGPAVVPPRDTKPTVFNIDDQDVYSVLMRWQRNFYP
jgi:hypothetical protein